MVIVYHYTNKQGFDAIKKHGYIAQSIDEAKDCAFGYGVYVTDLSQDVKKIKVAKNCWGQGYKSAIKAGKLDYAIRIEIPVEELLFVKDGERIIYVYRGELALPRYQHEFIKCKSDNDTNGILLLGLLTALNTIALMGVAVLRAIS